MASGWEGGEPDAPRITDLSGIGAENFKQRNTNFLTSDKEYELFDHQTHQDARHKIWVTRNGDLRQILRDFPTDAPVYEQCAGWVHAVAGRHFFPDANHRTAIATLRKLLQDNGIPPGQWPPRLTRDVVLRSHAIRREIENVRLDTLYRHDRLFLVWLLYFKTVLRVEG
ncbi:hypothetical protein [Halorhabdus salina]|uniref:hypothetical protein n=1 Tax=Halorhabdus salina TaxID=2750670 RepID=UPI0015EFC8FA|nr:hypothetical protein [Halorhabdus salina]